MSPIDFFEAIAYSSIMTRYFNPNPTGYVLIHSAPLPVGTPVEVNFEGKLFCGKLVDGNRHLACVEKDSGEKEWWNERFVSVRR